KLELMCYKVLMKEKRVTHRELFYKLLFDSHECCCVLLRYSRHSIGIMASSRGLVAGCLMIQEPNKEVVDCSMCGSSGYAITGDMSLLEKMSIRSDARYIIVVEKRLAEDRIFNQIPSILITAKGYIDIATRNPAWLAILGTFKFGSIGMGLEAYKYACNVKWLGVRGNDLQLIPEESYVPLKPRDLQIAKSLMSCDMLQIMFPFHGFCFDFSL
ncbi:hypothetical protein MKX03_018841, partial [Papaver bracteatum]